MKLVRVVIVAAVTFWPVVAYSSHATFMSGNELFKYCNAAAGTPDRLTYKGYVIGISDELTIEDFVRLPEQAVDRQAIDVVLNYLRANPAKRQDSASSMVGAALMDAFPCQPKPPR
jgi:hypothetical protein